MCTNMPVYDSSSKLLSVLHHIMGMNPTVLDPVGVGSHNDPRPTIISLRFSIPGTFDPPPHPHPHPHILFQFHVFLTLTQDHLS